MMENLSENTAYSERSSSWSLSLRTKLILSYLLISTIAITGLGYYIYQRILESNALIIDQLDFNVRQQAEAGGARRRREGRQQVAVDRDGAAALTARGDAGRPQPCNTPPCSTS